MIVGAVIVIIGLVLVIAISPSGRYYSPYYPIESPPVIYSPQPSPFYYDSQPAPLNTPFDHSPSFDDQYSLTPEQDLRSFDSPFDHSPSFDDQYSLTPEQ